MANGAFAILEQQLFCMWASLSGLDLCVQDLSALDPAKLTPLSPEVISRQATINIGARRPIQRVLQQKSNWQYMGRTRGASS